MMNKLSLAVLFAFFPVLAMADSSSLSFSPPPGDYSVVFLGNIFGIVDGVLHGSGSQIMGKMFSVFNAAVLALGGMVVMYTLLVSTMNTAHEGQVLGQKWSSIWIPVRSTVGLALLIPKASGYCLMQIFIMWIVVQGVGAADKIWGAALSYLNTGGVIIQSQITQNPPGGQLTPGTSEINKAAGVILSGQVCMLGLQKVLENQLKTYQAENQGTSPSGPCASFNNPSPAMQSFCQSTVPDFIDSVNMVTSQNTQSANYLQQNSSGQPPLYSALMPQFDSSSIYASLNGICGEVQWEPISKSDLSAYTTSAASGQATISSSDVASLSMSRAIAVQQMYVDLASVARVMVNNDPQLAYSENTQNETPKYPTAMVQFGVPLIPFNGVCPDPSPAPCTSWGPMPGVTGETLLNGTEYQGAISDYEGVMYPVLNLLQQAGQATSQDNARSFITNATTQGWLMAGSYFFDMINLNQSGNTSNMTDQYSGLDQSSFNTSTLQSVFGGSPSDPCPSTYRALCEWLQKDSSTLAPVLQLIQGDDSPALPFPTLDGSLHSAAQNSDSSTVYGYLLNVTRLQLPGQPGQAPLAFFNQMNASVDLTSTPLPPASFACGSVGFWPFSFCLGRMLGDVFYNLILVNIMNMMMAIISPVIDTAMNLMIMVPIQGMAAIFQQGVELIAQPGVNPIVALANMGTFYINFTFSFWVKMIIFSLVSYMLPGGSFVLILLGLCLPLLMGWLFVMVGIGFVTAYYVPLLPYMMFTFGGIAWLMAVIEAMVAAPIVALGVTHPEGHDAFGKGEQAVMILMNVFLRPSMMIIGYIAAISLSYVSVWIINAGFDHAVSFIQASSSNAPPATTSGGILNAGFNGASFHSNPAISTSVGTISGGYSSWAGVFAYFFSILIYTSLYLTVVQKAFGLIAILPDRVLRWIGGQPESYGAETQQWGDEAKGRIEKAGETTSGGIGSTSKALHAHGLKQAAQLHKAGSEASSSAPKGGIEEDKS